MSKRYDQHGRTDVEIVDYFAKAKGLPKVGRLNGGARLHHRIPDQVRIIKGRNVPYQAVGRLAAEAENRDMTSGDLADELFPEQEPQPSLASRLGKVITKALHIS